MAIAQTTEIGKLTPEAFARFAQYITGELGIKMPASKLGMVQSRLVRRVRELKLKSLEQYRDYFFKATHAEERERFINAITTNKTDFFREPPHFDYLTRTAIPALHLRPGVSLKLWCAGCSSGEEPYTLAMVLSEYALAHPGFDFSITGSDISTKVLAQARSAIYAEEQILPVPLNLRNRYLLRSRERSHALARVVPSLRHKVTFKQLNFMDEDYLMGETFDVVFFRNVLIYFDKPTQEAVVTRISRYLAPGGYMFISHSESLAGLNIPVKLVQASIFRKPVK